ncbi:hypothetical protein G6F37_003158 [Rhizopus arrhizus]|nr:hypothetical protein G6F38_003302 [Rhizopus arrhizus]KAG1161345.1 hypothetical protein G6F37_003158 [Rhizopus arrhizus]
MEIIKFVLSFLIQSGLHMYYDVTDTTAVAHGCSLIKELEEVKFVFSDKTGTLTYNEMQFRQHSIAGLSYADKVESDKQAKDGEHLKTHSIANMINEFLTLLAICHTVIPEAQESSEEITYQASSPDEGALVKGASTLHYKFHTRKPNSIACSQHGQDYEYQVLNICEFNSTHKRMSAIIRGPDGKIKLHYKGADTVILERLAENNPFVENTLIHLEKFASEGLRTLCIAMHEIPKEEYARWPQIYDKAATTLTNRAEELDKAAEMIEQSLFLLGATVIEDKLQDGVPNTIHTSQEAGIRVWVLTGDRQETAINIGYSCKLLNEEMSLIASIGDGANNVSMLQAAHVDVGISGVEGLQAVCSADFAISQFRYLKKLLLVHGAWPVKD